MISTAPDHDDLEIREFEEGMAILAEGEINSNVFLLKQGAVSISIGGEEICRVCTPEAIFGEVSALIGVEASATVKAVEPTSFWVINDFRSYMAQNPGFALSIAEELARRLSNMSLNFIELRSTLKELQQANGPEQDNPKKIVLDKYAVDEIKRLRQEHTQTAPSESDLSKVNKILHIRIDG